MIVNDRFDNQMQSALIKFKFQNNLFPPDATIDVKTSECIKQLLPVERLQQILNESAKSNSSAAFEINSMLRKLIFQRIQQQQTTLDETPIDAKTLDDLRSYLVKLMTEPAFIKFINAVIKNLPDKIYPDPNNLSIGVSVAKFNGTIVEKFDLLRKDGKLLLASNTKTKAFYEKNVIRFDRLHFKPYSDVIINQMITSNNLLDSIVKSDVGKGYQITEKLATVFTLVHELLHTYYPLTISSSLATSHE